MANENWEKAKRIFADAIKVAPDERVHFLDKVCAGDADIRREVESLLSSYDEAESFMENPAVGEVAETVVKEKLEGEPTKISYNYQTPVTDEEELPDAPDENALRPSRLRFALVCFLFVFVFGANVISLFQVFAVKSVKSGGAIDWIDDRLILTSTTAESADRVKIGDEIVSFNGEPINKSNQEKLFAPTMPANERYTLRIKREGEAELREVTLTTKPLPLARVVNQYLIGFLLPAAFLLTGLTVFLLKPNNKQVLITVALFAVVGVAVMPDRSFLELPVIFAFWWRAGLVFAPLFIVLLLHLFLVFPERSRLVRRFTNLEWLIYLPVLPLIVWKGLIQLALVGWTQFDFAVELATLNPNSIFTPIVLFYQIIIYGALYLLTALVLLLLNYLKADETGKRRIRLMVVSFTIALFPLILTFVILLPVGIIYGINLFGFLGDWENVVFWSPWLLIPPAFAYAIVRHKVIPVSFIIRRGLQYLLAKNALRLMLVLPILGVIWNIAVNPDRTVYEILLLNSFTFYFCFALAVGSVLLNRFGLREWIDRRFFREQYNQEKILRELTEAVKESDSLPKLSRLVSGRIQLALHPESIYLFFRDDRMNSDFSLGYTTNDASENSVNLKLAANSPLLRFMQQTRGAIEFPTRQTDDLPNREKRWLREINANLLVPMHSIDGKLAGIFSLGEKMSQIPYTSRDKELLETLANQIALVHENLSLKDRMRREQRIKTEILSRFDQADINLLKECPACGKCFDRNDERCDADDSELTFSLPVERTIESRYRLEKLIGKGGMGAVYEATDLRINRPVAVKILSGAMFGNRDALRRFEREAQTAGKLNHRNIVTIFDYGVLSTEGAFLVMELVAGETLSEVLKRKGKLDARTVAAWFGQVLDGVEAAHKAGIVHRDLKPDNIFVTRNEDETVRLCILDFGLARFSDHEFTDRVTAPGTIMGTLGYMPPEQLRGEKTDERSDLFAAGVIIYECLHGEKPFAGKNYQEVVQSMSQELVFGPRAPFANFLERSLRQKAAGRYASASEMKYNLSNLALNSEK